MSEPILSCKTLEQDLSLLAADCLTEEEAVAVQAHLVDCSVCRERLQQLTVVCDQLAKVGPTIPALDVKRFTANVLADVSVAPAKQSSGRAWLIAGGVMVAACLVTLLAVRTMFRTNPQVPEQAAGPGIPHEEAPVPRPTALAIQPPTWLDYQQAWADSDEAVDRLLDREADRLAFLSFDAFPNSRQEFLP